MYKYTRALIQHTTHYKHFTVFFCIAYFLKLLTGIYNL